MRDQSTRLGELLPDGRGVWIAIDHSVSSPLSGLIDIGGLVDALDGADALVAHKGVVRHFAGCDARFVMHLSASTVHGGSHADDKVLVGTVAEAVQHGAHCVSVQVNLGSEHEAAMLERLGCVASQCAELGMPLLGMIYPRGPNLSIHPDDITNGVAHCARLGFELGCDVVKVPWTGDEDSFSQVIAGVPIPVLVAGGPDDGDAEQLFEMIESAMTAGASGVCIGRNVFNSPDPAAVLSRIQSIINDPKHAAEVD